MLATLLAKAEGYRELKLEVMGLLVTGRGVWVPLPDRGPANLEACGHSDSGTGPPQAPVASGMPELAGWSPDAAGVLSCL